VSFWRLVGYGHVFGVSMQRLCCAPWWMSAGSPGHVRQCGGKSEMAW